MNAPRMVSDEHSIIGTSLKQWLVINLLLDLNKTRYA